MSVDWIAWRDWFQANPVLGGAAGVTALVLLIALLYLAVGLFQARSLARREFGAYFISPIAYVVLVVFLSVTGFLFSVSFNLLTTTGPEGTDAPWRTMFADERFWLVFLFVPPLLTMRLFAEERASGTLEMLMTAPLRDWQVVLCKFLAALAFYVVLWLPTLAYLPALQNWNLQAIRLADVRDPAVWTPWAITFVSGLGAMLLGALLLLPRVGTLLRLVSFVLLFGGFEAALVGGIEHYTLDEQWLLRIPSSMDPFPALTTYLGIFLTGAMFLSIGLFVSSLVRDQLVAAILAIACSLPFVLAGFLKPEGQAELVDQVVYFFSVPLHFDRAFTRGVLDTRPLVLYVSLTALCLFLTVRSLESRRWQ
jgi:ABC-type transport system involved in multi-copper enzyme maturation permease subunit